MKFLIWFKSNQNQVTKPCSSSKPKAKVIQKKRPLAKPIARKKATRKSSKQLVPAKPSRLAGLFSKQTLLAPIKNNPLSLRNNEQKQIDSKLALAFKQLHHEFNQREKQLEARMQEIKLQHEILIAEKQKRARWLLPIGFAAGLAGAYMLFVLTNMQNSMSSMTGSIENMNGNMAAMSSDMRYMSQNVQTMNQSMYQMNNNVKGMSQAMQPMGDVAQAASPFTKMFKSMMPF